MLKKALLLIAGSIAAQGLYAGALTPEQALDRLAGTAEGKKMIASRNAVSLALTKNDCNGQPAVYVFNRGEDAGMMVVAANDVASPLLGYADNGSFDPSDIAPGFEYWMNEYARQIEYAEANGLSHYSGKQKASANQTYIAPLCETQWNQMNPYNLLTPESGASHTPTGCVATAMAQVMKYWNYPEIGKGNISYVNNYTGQTLSMYFDRQPFEWDLMLNRYSSGKYTTEQADAVAYLMKACGYSVRMQYMMGGSGAAGGVAGAALYNNFSYDGNIQYAQRMCYTNDEWNDLIYDQLKNVGPVLYDGTSPEGGHAFVVDGFDGNGFFHLNWGWGGKSDGFYLLTALNPSQQGAGGGYGGFNFSQGCIYNIQKPTGQPSNGITGRLSLKGNLSATMSAGTITFHLNGMTDPGYGNFSMVSVKSQFGIGIQKADGSGTETYVACIDPSYAVNLDPGQYFPAESVKPIVRFPSNLADGKYKVTIMYKPSGASSYESFITAVGCYDYVYVVKAGSSYTVENNPALELSVTDAAITTPLYFGNPCLVEYTITNSSDVDLTQSLRPTLYIDGSLAYEGDTQLVAVGPNKSEKVTIQTIFNRVGNAKIPSSSAPIEVTLGSADYSSGVDYGKFGTYTMYRAGNGLKVTLKDLEITNASEKSDYNSSTPLFGIDNFSAINLSATVEVSGTNAFIASPLTAVISEYDPEKGSYEQIYEKDFPNMIYLSTGQSATETVSLHMDKFNVSQIYSVSINYEMNHNRVSIGSVFFAASSGIDGILAEGEGIAISVGAGMVSVAGRAGLSAVTVYDLSGIAVAMLDGAGSESVSIPVSGLDRGIYVVRAEDLKGNSKICKVRL